MSVDMLSFFHGDILGSFVHISEVILVILVVALDTKNAKSSLSVFLQNRFVELARLNNR